MSEQVSPQKLIADGRRELICKNVDKAVELLGAACEQLSQKNGDLAPELAEPNFYYGCALLELARMESGVIGNALKGIPEVENSDSENENVQFIVEEPEMTEEMKESISDQIIDAMCEPREGQDEIEKETEENDETNDVEIAHEVTEETEKAENEEDEESGEGEEKEDVVETEDDEEEVDNLQLAWEVFEVAKKIYSEQTSLEAKIKYSDCFEKLAEISREKEDYEQALDDLQECLHLRNEIQDLPENDKIRLIAETEYQMGTTCYLASWLDRAAKFYRSAHDQLNDLCDLERKNLEKLKQDLENDSSKEELVKKVTEAEELVVDLSDIVNEIKSRCGDVDEERLDEKLCKPQESSGFDSSLTKDSVKTDDISHLVRKKRPASDVDSVKENKPDVIEDPVAKKTKVANNGDVEDSLPVNGVA